MIAPEASAAFVANMEDVLEVYQRPHDAKRPLVCLDETSIAVGDGARIHCAPPAQNRTCGFPAYGSPPRVSDGKSAFGPGMKNSRRGEKFARQAAHPIPSRAVLLAAALERPSPEVDDMEPKGAERGGVRRHGEVAKVPRHDLPEPSPLLGDGSVHALAQTFLDLLQLRPHAVRPGLPLDLEAALAGFAADQREAEEGEGLRLAKPASLPVRRRMAAELDEPGLVRMQRQRKRPQPFAHRVPEAPGVALVLKAGDDVVGVPHDDHVALRLAPSPALGPAVEDIVQVDVGEQRRDHRALPRSPVARLQRSVFENTRLQPFLEQADDALVADAVLDEPDEPVLAHRLEEPRNVGVEYPVHPSGRDPHHERVQRVMRAASWSEPVAEAEEILLVDRVQHRRRRPLDDLVLQRGDRQRTLPSGPLGR